MRPPDGPLAGAPVSFPQDLGASRPILPTYDGPGGEPDLVYKVSAGGGNADVAVNGQNCMGPYTAALVDIHEDGGNSNPAPSVLAVVATDVQVVITLDPAGSAAGDIWGILLTDANGDVYAPPSPIFMT